MTLSHKNSSVMRGDKNDDFFTLACFLLAGQRAQRTFYFFCKNPNITSERLMHHMQTLFLQQSTKRIAPMHTLTKPRLEPRRIQKSSSANYNILLDTVSYHDKNGELKNQCHLFKPNNVQAGGEVNDKHAPMKRGGTDTLGQSTPPTLSLDALTVLSSRSKDTEVRNACDEPRRRIVNRLSQLMPPIDLRPEALSHSSFSRKAEVNNTSKQNRRNNTNTLTKSMPPIHPRVQAFTSYEVSKSVFTKPLHPNYMGPTEVTRNQSTPMMHEKSAPQHRSLRVNQSTRSIMKTPKYSESKVVNDMLPKRGGTNRLTQSMPPTSLRPDELRALSSSSSMNDGPFETRRISKSIPGPYSSSSKEGMNDSSDKPKRRINTNRLTKSLPPTCATAINTSSHASLETNEDMVDWLPRGTEVLPKGVGFCSSTEVYVYTEHQT